ncbi:MAG: PAS domain-containing protein [Cyanobacteria bacterium J06648_10]
MNPIDFDEDRDSSPLSPEVSALVANPVFNIYNNTDKSGVVALATDARATILYTNPKFAWMLGTTPQHLVGRPLDAIAANSRPHSVATKGFVADGIDQAATKVTRAMQGGRFVEAFIQGGRRKGQRVRLKVYSIELAQLGDDKYMLGYVEQLTRLEYLIEISNVNEALDGLWKPVARFFLSGRWRPFVTSAMGVILPIVLAKWPAIGALLQQLLGL